MRVQSIVLLGVLLSTSKNACAVELKAETVVAFDHYVADLEVRLNARSQGAHFLWFDDVTGLGVQLLKGSAAVRPADGSGLITVKGGLIQDWLGAVFVPNCSLKTVLGVVQDYGLKTASRPYHFVANCFEHSANGGDVHIPRLCRARIRF